MRCAVVPARSTVTFLPSADRFPAVLLPAVVQVVFSVSSIRLRSWAACAVASAPLVSPVATAPAFADAQLSANRSVIATSLPSRMCSRKRTCPYPGAVATNSYVPGANLATLSRLTPVVAGSVSPIGDERAS